ncbi:DUF2957 domain-containing protein [Paraburkholderia flava]|uniref:DUF2957 domain-containing protein n=1 Tax=Paraburkholderia flava TaxID=2547393 RepID=UPI00105D76F6|nr:DUF2957 domain-containing protein [Paraburkholderia flava]
MARIVRDGFAVANLVGIAAAAVLMVACSGGNPGSPGPVDVSQCSGSTCAPSGPPTSPPSTLKLCPDALDYSTTFTGGSGSGEYIKAKFNSATKQYQMTFVESEVPTRAGQINATRQGLTITGSYTTPDAYKPTATSTDGGTTAPLALPSAEQNRCAIVLKDGQTADGSYKIPINLQDPPLLFVGQGIIGGSSPGAEIQFNGVPLGAGIFIGVVPDRVFDSFPFIGFSETVTDFSQVAGKYNELGFRMTPEGTTFQTIPNETPAQQITGLIGWQPDAIQASETLNADGSCTADTSKYSCMSTGAPWVVRTNADGSADNVFMSAIPSNASTYPAVGVGTLQVAFAGNTAHGVMIVGKVAGTLVPVIVRVGAGHSDPNGNLLASILDDQIGISLLAPATTIAPTVLTGGYIGANSASACGLVEYAGQSAQATNVTNPDGSFSVIYPSAGACIDGSASFNAAVNSTATLFQNPNGSLLTPFTATVTSGFTLDYTQTQPGLVNVTATKDLLSGTTPIFQAGDTGVLVKVGQVYGLLMNGVNQQFTTNSPSNTSKVNPFLTIGAFVQ